MGFPPSLSKYILSNTAEQIFLRGVEYAKQDRIHNLELHAKKLRAFVQGSERYEVEFRQGPKYAKGSCTCPYALNEDYCKHVVALAVAWDLENGVNLPSKEELAASCLKIDYGFGNKIEAIYRDPLHADLQLLAEASDYGSWTRPHAKIALHFPLGQGAQAISFKELRAGLKKIARLESRAGYDPYFCAGEVSALLSLAFDSVIQRAANVSLEEYLALLKECILFYYNTYLPMIDGSDGVWQIPFARIQLMFGDLERRGAAKEEQNALKAMLNKNIQGWGDIFEELKIQF
ncbi:MAG: SWIM zinc finger family protein [Candidatus Wildermuthbacteria bacterium]|nr:SWIM zinc finger family protein [Candidatus Wildermuthbacteria bacterium]